MSKVYIILYHRDIVQFTLHKPDDRYARVDGAFTYYVEKHDVR